MTINPTELEKKANEKTSSEIEMLEKIIDKALTEGVLRNGTINRPITLDYKLLENATEYSRERIIHQYKLAGWDVKLQSDQRDGDWYTFKKSTRLGGCGDGK